MMDKKLTHIADLIGSDNLLTDPASLAAYAASASYSGAQARPPVAVARPRHPAQLAGMVAFCASEGLPITIRGDGTKSCNPPEGSILLTTTGLDRIYEINAMNRSAHLQAGAQVAAFQKVLEVRGLFCPAPAPGTIGGGIAVNPAGCQALKYGPISNFIQSLEVCLASGERLDFAVAGNAAGAPGFPLAPLFCGNRGELGIITACRLRLMPAPKSSAISLARFGSVQEAAEAAKTVLRLGLMPAGLDLLDALCAQALGFEAQPILAAKFAGGKSEVEAELQSYKAISKNEIQATALNMSELTPRLVKLRGFFELLSASSPPARLTELLKIIESLASENNLQIAIFGDAAVATLKIAVFLPTAESNLAEFKRRLFAAELMLNDALESEADAELSAAEWQKRHERQLDRQLKNLLDPACLLNQRRQA